MADVMELRNFAQKVELDPGILNAQNSLTIFLFHPLLIVRLLFRVEHGGVLDILTPAEQ